MNDELEASPRGLAGRTALVTGGGAGIGAAAVERLRRGGAAVAVFDLRPEGAGDDVLAIEGDTRDSAALDDAVARVERDLSGLDILVCCAGVFGRTGGLAEIEDDDWRGVFAVNVEGTFFANRAALPGMVERGYGRIVNLASVAGKEGNPAAAAYAASKAAVIALTKSIAKETIADGVLAHSIAPALIDTPMVAGMGSEDVAAMIAKIPLGRLGTPAEVADLIAFLASEEFSFSTGSCFDLSGGRATF